ncbi:MAG: hypothetical protein AAF961_02535 [Planctomycetota bacterium]
MHYRFHANLFKMPDRLAQVGEIVLRDQPLAPLREPDGGAPTFDEFLPLTFEATLESLGRLPRVDAEPDGFFVYSGGATETRWQLNGHLYDFGGQMHRIQLHGDCPADSFDALLRCLNWPTTNIAFELVLEGVALGETGFRAWAAAPA